MRIPSFLAISAYALGAQPGAVRAQTPATDSLAVSQAVRQFHEALTRGDSTAALALLAEDAVILESGGIESRSEYRAHHLPADIQSARAVPAKAGPVRVRVVGDLAWVTSTSEVEGTYEGRTISSVGAELAVLTRTSKGWLIRAIHWSSRRRAAP